MLSLYLHVSQWKSDTIVIIFETHPIKSIVLMMNPSVGLTVVTSSFMTLLTMVVLPALSKPLSALSLEEHLRVGWISYSISIRISLSFRRAFLNIDNILEELSSFLGV